MFDRVGHIETIQNRELDLYIWVSVLSLLNFEAMLVQHLVLVRLHVGW